MIHSAEVFDEVPIFGEVTRDLFFAGTLAPDTYTLRVGATSLAEGTDDSFASGLSVWGVDFTVVVPEPGTGALVASGLVLLAGGRRSHARRALAHFSS